jgi:hypothetical protein
MNNPLAFPMTWVKQEAPNLNVILEQRGMTLRDYFATGAMQNFRDQIGSQSDQEWFDQMAQGAYRVADAMMKARTK